MYTDIIILGFLDSPTQLGIQKHLRFWVKLYNFPITISKTNDDSYHVTMTHVTKKYVTRHKHNRPVMPSKNYSISNSHNSLTLFKKSKKCQNTLSGGFVNSTNKIVNMLKILLIADWLLVSNVVGDLACIEKWCFILKFSRDFI